MATPKPGEIRCPTCHRSTPPAAFCTQCGWAIPPDARARPRGMDRDELQDRIRARRSGGEPFRRGGMADEPPGYERFEPEPDDSRARREARPEEHRRDYFDEAAGGAGAIGAAGATGGAGAASRPPEPDRWPPEPGVTPVEERPSLTRDRDEWFTPATPPPPPPVAPRAEAVPEPAGRPEPEYVDNFDDEAYDYEYDAWEEPRERRSGAGALAILGFLALGVLALLGGALLGGVFDDGNGGVGNVSPTPSASATVSAAAATPSASAAPSEAASSSAPSGSPSASGGPIVFPDGFVAEAQPCLPGSATGTGCDSNAAVNSGSVWVWVGFENGSASDVVGATVLGPDGSSVDGSIDLSRIGCRQECKGWTYFPFSGLPVGTYDVEITRNGEPAGTTSFEVS